MQPYIIIVLLFFMFFAVNRIKQLYDLLEAYYKAIQSKDQYRITRLTDQVEEELNVKIVQ